MFKRNTAKNKPRGAVRMQTTSRQQLAFQINRRWLLVFLMFGLIAAGAVYIRANWQQTVVPLEQVSIDGEFKYLSPEVLQHTIESKLFGGYFTIDLREIRQALLQLPWVQEVSVRRQWPSGLHIIVQEKTAIAYWGDKALLSDKGEVFAPQQIAADMNLPVLIGPDGLHKTVWQFMTRLYKDFNAMGLQVNKLVLDQRRAWQVYLASGTMIRLGRNETEQRLQRFNKVFAMSNAPDISNAVTIDMRYPNGFAMLNKNVMKNNTNNNTNNTDGSLNIRVREV